MLKAIASFEWRYQSRSAALWTSCALFALLSFGSATLDQVQIGDRAGTHVNAPFAVLRSLATLSLFATYALVGMVANMVLRDDETRFGNILRATPLSRRDYLLGRFCGVSAAALPMYASIPLAIALGAAMPFQDSERIGPLRALDYAYALAVFGVPTLLVTAAGCFAIATLTRSVRWSYVVTIGLSIAYLVMQSLLKDPRHSTLVALADPYGIGTLETVTRYWTTSEKNGQLPALSGLLLYNRLLWLGLAAGAFAVAFKRFRFADAAQSDGRARGVAIAEATPQPSAASMNASTSHSRVPAALVQCWMLARHEIAYVLRSPGYLALLGLGVFNAVGHLWSIGEWYGSPSYPVTRLMVKGLYEAFSLVPLLIAIHYGSDLVWRDRELRVHELVDATSAPDWAHLLPKVVALCVVLLSTLGCACLSAIGLQLFQGFTRLELGSYVLWYALPNTISALQLSVLAICVQVLVPHKFVGWAVMLGFLVASVALSSVGYEHHLYDFASGPDVPLSDMNGLGRFWIGDAWFKLYWSAFAVLLSLAAHVLWRRGNRLALWPRLRSARRRMTGPVLAIGAVSSLLWLGSGAFIYYNTNVLNRYRPAPERERMRAERERTLLGFERVVQPRIRAVSLDVQLHPRETRVVTRGEYVLENHTSAPLPAVHVRWHQKTRLDQLALSGASLEREWPDLQYRIYQLQPPLAPRERRVLRFATTLQERGFPNDGALTRVVDNGTFVDNDEIGLNLGMSQDGLLRDRAKRHKYKLPRDLRPPPLEDESARANNALQQDSDLISASIRVTTDADQLPIAPGYVKSDTTTAGRRTVQFQTDAPIAHLFSIQSGRYAIERDKWRDVDLAVYYHPAHAYNVPRMLKAMRSSLALYNERFGPYQFKQARIIEFPAYADFAQGFANTIPYSESLGFLHHYSDPEKIDTATYVTAHEVAHQWWAHQLIPSQQQGAAMLTETFSQYSALLVMEKLYGAAQIRRFLKYELDRYLKARGGEAFQELPLVRVEDQDYIHYFKGSLVMFWLRDVLGEAVLDGCMRSMLERYASKGPPYPNARDFVSLLAERAGPQHAELIGDLFDRITLLDLKAKQARVSQRADGRYDVRLELEAHKFYADGQGVQQEAPLEEQVDVGVFTAEPGKRGFDDKAVLYLARHALHTGLQTLELVVDGRPRFAGVDPYNKRIDRVSDDNLAEVDLQ